MKQISLIFTILIVSLSSKAQNSVGYSYDANGNRIQRYFVGLRPLSWTNERDSSRAMEESKRLAEEKGLKVYPNPTQDKINILFSKPGQDPMELNDVVIYIFDNSGKATAKLKCQGIETSFDMRGLPPGNYNLKIVFNDKDAVNYKILKVN